MSLVHATSVEAFESKYRRTSDPWNFRHSPYEQDRYRKILASLSRPRYLHAFEPGCSVGEFTRLLAGRCQRVSAMDVSITALARAKERCRDHLNVRYFHDALGCKLPAEGFDLIVLSEVAYYFSRTRLAEIARGLDQALAPAGELLAAHWLGHSADHELHGDETHRILLDTLSLRPGVAQRFEGFRLDTWIKT